MQRFEDFDLNSLQNPIWIYDVVDYTIFWANSTALKLWEADSLEELQARDFKADSSEAVKQRLMGYLHDCEAGRSTECWWRISPKGIDKQVFLKYTGIKIFGDRTAMLIEGTYSELLNHSMGNAGKSAILGLFNAQAELVSYNPPFKDQFGSNIRYFSDLFSTPTEFNLLQQPTSFYEGDQLLVTLHGLRWHRLELRQEHLLTDIVASFTDIHERKLSEMKYVQDSVTDSLTGLLNRRGLLQQLKVLKDIPYSLFYIDLDGFKPINDSYGHAVGDILLKRVARILREDIYPNVVCARFGGDEFIVVIADSLLHDDREKVAKSLVQHLSAPIKIDDTHQTLISASIGIAHHAVGEADTEQTLVRADSAMYTAKRNGRNRYVNYIPGMEEHLLKRSLIVQELESAIAKNELVLHYQLVFKGKEPQVVGAEALLRWSHPTLGNICPLEVITAAEETGRISALENWVIKRSCLDLAPLKKIYGKQFTIGVNISGAHLSQMNFVDDILSVLNETHTKPSDIVLELTESILVNTLEKGQKTLQELRDIGFLFAIDDFGTGYSSLAYLSQIPASFVKIDKAFTDNIDKDPHTIGFIRDLCRNLNMHCLIEGVETSEQAAQLDSLDIYYRQGYYYARPAPLEYLTNLPRDDKATHSKKE